MSFVGFEHYVLGQVLDPPFIVTCRGSREGGSFTSSRLAMCAAQNIADHEDTICSVTDRLGRSIQLMRGSGLCPDAGERYPYPESVPRFHPHPEHPRSARRYLRNEPEAYVPVQESREERMKRFRGIPWWVLLPGPP